MAMSTAGIITRGSALFFLTAITFMQPTHALRSNGFEIFARTDSGSCPTSYDYCGSDLPSNFCCKSTETCLVVDNNSTVVCCPSGDDCNAISTITCNIQQQNATAHPTAAVKTTLLDESLTKCGDACCPHGYTCKDSYCIVDTNTTSTTTASSSTASSTSDTSSTSSSSSTSTASGTSVTPIGGSVSASSINADSTSTCTSCPSFPSKAVIAGFFPGALLGAIIALLLSTCIRHRKEKKHEAEVTQAGKGGHGHSWSISSPIATEDNSYRTDFLLQTSKDKHASVGSRVRSLFSNGQPKTDKDVPPLPQTNIESIARPGPVTPPRQREPSTESIKVYSPPGAFMQSRRFLGPEPYPSRIARPSTTFSDLVQAVGFNEPKGAGQAQVKEPKAAQVKEAKEGRSFKVHQVRKIT